MFTKELKLLRRANSRALAFGVFGSVLIMAFWGFSVWAGGVSLGWGWTWVSSVWPVVVPAWVWLWSRLCSWTCSCSLALFFLFSFFLSCLRCIWAASFFWDSFWRLENRKRKTAAMRHQLPFFPVSIKSTYKWIINGSLFSYSLSFLSAVKKMIKSKPQSVKIPYEF